MSIEERQKNFALLRERLLETRGKEYWRNLEELADSSEFEELVKREYPHAAEEWDDSVSRRSFIKLMGASMALAGLSACAYQPTETIVPFVRDPEGYTPGKPSFYATAMSLGGAATGLLVRSNEGRPTKVEGNELHPASLGASDIYSQASVLGLYDPDRSQVLSFRGEIRTWSTFLGAVSQALDNQRPKQGAGIRFLTETITSPTLAAQITDILREFPGARWYQYEPVGRGQAGTGAFQAFGQSVNVVYDFTRADRILGLDADFLACGPASLRYARQFASRRRVEGEGGADRMNRFYCVESTPTNTGASADHRWPLRPSEIEGFARAIASRLGVTMAGNAPAPASIPANVLDIIARDLQAAGRGAVVVPGDEQPAIIHALAHAMNQKLGSVGNAVNYTEPIEFRPPGQENTALDSIAELRTLVQEMNSGAVDMLVMVGGNPIYNAPADLQFRQSMEKVGLRIHLSLYDDETSALCHWHVPESHFLESWGDARAFDGTVSIIQPLIAPLYRGTKSPIEFLAAFTQQPERTGYEIVRAFWQDKIGSGGAGLRAATAQGTGQRAASAQQPASVQNANTATANGNQSANNRNANNQATGNQANGNRSANSQANANTQTSNQTANAASTNANNAQAGVTPPTSTAQTTAAPAGDFESQWRRALHDGVIPNTALPVRTVSLAGNWDTAQPQAPSNPNELELVFRADPSIYDGRFANNGWLQELPKPHSKITWDTAAVISPATARRLGLENELGWKGGEWKQTVVNLTFQNRTVPFPVWVQPGQPDNTVTVYLGYGRWRAGRAGTTSERSTTPNFQNAYALRTSNALWSGTGLRLEKTAEIYQIATTQLHHLMENRDLVRAGTLEDYKQNPHFAPEGKHEPKREDTMYENYDYSKGYAWGMAIDVSTCIGCNACVVACQSENNIPVVGKEQVLRSREMHWLRVDSYYKGEEANPQTFFQPVPCMHCENAPCEPVCPVAATVHSAEGTNDMVYNRCVGTRYCSNNCPYKVRRFNFLLFQDFETPTYKLMRNPEVSVRSRGVMEKCTYCIQRIQYAKIESEKEERPVRDGEIVTACQAACPADAIVFGNQNDPNSRVAKLKAQERNYGLLSDLNTRPRTTYLAAIRNINPEIGPKSLMGNMNPEQGKQGDH
ncbi:MAG TPA: TAT-variant-translocated molybdopterin oxidoreductase [Pyrinomonadaceae bacterium]|nr:TAT-variant-translocated molybdopterin oxidoreductase [Pyrinomonadaceae bacterium]